jgi:hypothetical protein
VIMDEGFQIDGKGIHAHQNEANEQRYNFLNHCGTCQLILRLIDVWRL